MVYLIHRNSRKGGLIIKNKLYKFMTSFLAILFILALSPRANVMGMENDSDTTGMVVEEVTEIEEVTAVDTNTPAGDPSFVDYLPFGQFVNYKYRGDGIEFSTQDIIMEYAPDTNGVFQVSAFMDNDVVAYIYQVREDGLYLLAEYNEYYVVEDLRYSEDALNELESLILPSNLQVGQSYQTGYYKDINRYVAEIIPEYYFGGHYFNNVYRIEETRYEEGINQLYYYYYAPTYGLIIVEKIDSGGQANLILQLISTQGILN